jgi:hypothetical protein
VHRLQQIASSETHHDLVHMQDSRTCFMSAAYHR